MIRLSCMKCIHLPVDGLEQYFKKRGFTSLYIQPKFNGIRALWHPGQGLFTRGDHLITSVPHIENALKELFPRTPLDGELYHRTIPFNKINGAARRKIHNNVSLNLEYHIFDKLNVDELQGARLNFLDSEIPSPHRWLKKAPCFNTRPTSLARNLESLLAKGFEGIIIRAPRAVYCSGRHVGNLWAVKPVFEIEVMFIGYLPPGDETSLHSDTFGSLLLKLPGNGRTFSCSGINESERSSLWENPLEEGTWITIKFGAWSHDNPEKAVPLYPRFKCVRWDK